MRIVQGDAASRRRLRPEERRRRSQRGLEAVESLAHRRQWNPEGVMLTLVPAGSDAQDEAAIRHVIEHRRRLCEHGGVTEGCRRHGDAQPSAPNMVRERREGGECLERNPAAFLARVREMIAHPAGVEGVKFAGPRPHGIQQRPVQAHGPGG